MKEANIPPDSRSKFNADQLSSISDANVEITALILTYNEADNIGPCIESLTWADRIVVYDSFSDDETAELAEVAGAELLRIHFIITRNSAMPLWTAWKLIGFFL